MKRITRTYSSSWGVEWTTADKASSTVPGVRGEPSPRCAIISVPHLRGYESVQWFWVAGRLTNSCFPLHVKVRTTHLDLLAKGEAVWILRETGGLWEKLSFQTITSEGCSTLSPVTFLVLFLGVAKKGLNARAILGSYLSPPLLWFLMHLSRLFPGLGHHSPSPGDFCLFTS